MPIHFTFDKEKNILYCVANGTLTPDEFYNKTLSMTQSSEYSADVRTLWDIRNLDFDIIDTDFQKKLIAIREAIPARGKTKIACVADSDLSFGLTRMYQILSSDLPQELMVFRDFAKAEQWLLNDDSLKD